MKSEYILYIIYIAVVLYSATVAGVYLYKYFKKNEKYLKTKRDKIILFIRFLPTVLLFLHFTLMATNNPYNDFSQVGFGVYDHSLSIKNQSKYTKHYLIALFDEESKSWRPVYQTHNYRFSPLITSSPRSSFKTLFFIDKHKDILSNKIMVVDLNKSRKLNDTLQQSIFFFLPSPPIKLFSSDFYTLKPEKEVVINNTYEYIKLFLYITIFPFLFLFVVYSTHRFLKFLYYFLNFSLFVVLIFLIYNSLCYLWLLYF